MDINNTKPRVGVIVGSNRPRRIGREIAEWVQMHLQHEQLDISLIDLAEVNLPFLDEPIIPSKHQYQQPHTKAWSELISSYDGFAIVYPQYNWGYPAVLKNALDFLYDEWAGKPVSLLCYGNHGGFQGLIALKLVVAGLHMQNMATNPPLVVTNNMFASDGSFSDIEAALAVSQQPVKALAEEFVSILIK